MNQAKADWEATKGDECLESPRDLAARVELLSTRVAELREALLEAYEQLFRRDEEIALLQERLRRIESSELWRLSTPYRYARDGVRAILRPPYGFARRLLKRILRPLYRAP